MHIAYSSTYINKLTLIYINKANTSRNVSLFYYRSVNPFYVKLFFLLLRTSLDSLR